LPPDLTAAPVRAKKADATQMLYLSYYSTGGLFIQPVSGRAEGERQCPQTPRKSAKYHVLTKYLNTLTIYGL